MSLAVAVFGNISDRFECSLVSLQGPFQANIYLFNRANKNSRRDHKSRLKNNSHEMPKSQKTATFQLATQPRKRQRLGQLPNSVSQAVSLSVSHSVTFRLNVGCCLLKNRHMQLATWPVNETPLPSPSPLAVGCWFRGTELAQDCHSRRYPAEQTWPKR